MKKKKNQESDWTGLKFKIQKEYKYHIYMTNS